MGAPHHSLISIRKNGFGLRTRPLYLIGALDCRLAGLLACRNDPPRDQYEVCYGREHRDDRTSI